MLNTEDLIQRIKLLLEEHELNASAFAEKIGVQRSSISHILSGRNKPSLEFLAKIESAFEEVSFEWLLKGSEQKSVISSPTPSQSQISSGIDTVDSSKKTETTASKEISNDPVVKIVHYYADGSFESFFKR